MERILEVWLILFFICVVIYHAYDLIICHEHWCHHTKHRYVEMAGSKTKIASQSDKYIVIIQCKHLSCSTFSIIPVVFRSVHFFFLFFSRTLCFFVCAHCSVSGIRCAWHLYANQMPLENHIFEHGGMAGGGQFFSDVSNLFLFGMEVLEFFYHLTAKEVNNSSAHSTYCSTTSEKTITGKTEEKQTQREITIKYSPWYVLITMHPFRFQATHSADHYHW